MLLGEQIAWTVWYLQYQRQFFSANFSIWLPQVRSASMSTPRDFDVDTWFTGVPLMLRPRLYSSFSETKIWEKVELISIVLSVFHKLKPGDLTTNHALWMYLMSALAYVHIIPDCFRAGTKTIIGWCFCCDIRTVISGRFLWLSEAAPLRADL